MSQQSFQFNPDHQDETPRYERENPDAVQGFDFTSDFSGQKLSLRETNTQPTTGQRLALAIVSLLFLFLYTVALVALFQSNAIGDFFDPSDIPAFAYFGLGLCITVIVVNVLFNRKR